MLPPIPDVPASLEPDTVPMRDWKSFPEVKIDIPVTPGPFEPTWESIEKNYPCEPAWLREAKFGIWIHFARNPQERVAIGMHAGSGSHAWTIPGEGEQVDGKLKMLPGGKLEQRHANFKFAPQDFRFTIGKDSAVYAFCMTVPEPETQLKIKSLGTGAKNFSQPVKKVTLLGHNGELQWKQESDGLAIICPAEMPFRTSIVFKIE